MSSIPSKHFESADFRASFFRLLNCKLKRWQSSELLRYICNVVNCCDCHCRGHQGHWLWCAATIGAIGIGSTVNDGPFRGHLDKFGYSRVLRGNNVIIVKTKFRSSRRRATRPNLLADTARGHMPQRQVRHVPNI